MWVSAHAEKENSKEGKDIQEVNGGKKEREDISFFFNLFL